ncbi:T9SS type A sorting domain-containing protein, partial [Flavobacterium sp.]|uniref:T9SS type A sorting domain-containing protein n=1 Tax=Flavobacterium sp. TaxID=239 RepID=UPI000ED32B4E
LLTFIFLMITSLSSAQEKKQNTVFGRPVKHITPSGHIRCATDEYEEYLQENNPKRMTRDQFENWLQPLIEKQQQFDMLSSQSGGIIYIPVVVHVIHNGDAYGTNENITDAQVQSQITVMTQDFRRMLGTPGYNTNTVGADTQIEFVLAKVDPNGNPTNGINRVNLCQASWSTGDINSTVKTSTIWDPTLYMNMWSVNFSDPDLLGYAQFPDGSTLGGLNASGGAANTDGVVAGYRFFGSSDLTTGNFAPPFDKGRTMTHEVGHFLGLRHIWGDNTNCTVNPTDSAKDYCPDTPATAGPNGGCVTANTCPLAPGNDMIENYMDYTDDSCMNIFTADQKARMVTVMNNSPRRASLKTSTKDIAIALFANDAEVKIENSCSSVEPTCSVPNPTSPAKIISLYNRGTNTLTSATLSYNMNGGTNYTNSWTGSLAPNAFAYITLANTNTAGTLNVSITNVNGGADARATNNTTSKSFGTGSLAYANATTFTFNLIGDSYGTEVTWTLKNQAGATLYSGGPYTNQTPGATQPLVTNQSWTLPANGCYYLTVNDSWGDGLFDGSAQGSYTVTAGSTTLVNVANFAASGNPANTLISRVSYFTNNASLNNTSFDFTGDIYVYPNPSRNELNISIPEGAELPKTLAITNSLGQSIMTRKVENNDNLNINTSSLSNGVYFVTISNENYTKTLRFIKE